MIQLLGFQSEASTQIANRFKEYCNNRPLRGTVKNPRPVPFYQALDAITGSGKTIILADAVERMRPLLPIQPFVMWLSKGRVVVSQAHANLVEGGKYHHLISSFSMHLLADYKSEYAAEGDVAHFFFATVGTFNQKDKERGDRQIYKSEIDVTELSVWNALKKRENRHGQRRPLIIVYDEAQNLSDQQTALLLELEPDAFVVASATMRIPGALGDVLSDLKRDGWTDQTLVTSVKADSVAQSGLIKDEISMGGYASPMEQTIDEMLADMEAAAIAVTAERLPFQPKAIYVCKTNIVQGNSLQRDNACQPFMQREAPPILIWRYLVYQKNIDPAQIAVYCTLDFDRNYPPPGDFILFKGDSDYDDFVAGDFRHIIFNLSLQEGWDDPSCYFAYIDKSMGSSVQVEQLVGRVLRQPGGVHYVADVLNTAHLYVRVDAKNVFADVVESVRKRLEHDAPEVKIKTYGLGSGGKPVSYLPSAALTVPKVYLDSSEALEPVQRLIEQVHDYRKDTQNTTGKGARALIQQRVGVRDDSELKWLAVEHNNSVSARWAFQRAAIRLFPKVLHVAGSDEAKFDAMIEIGSRAYTAMSQLADDVVAVYFQYVSLRQRQYNPYFVGSISADPAKVKPFAHSLHSGYADLNPLEYPFAAELDRAAYPWCRNPPRTGFGIPLLTIGKTQDFYPDFLVWKGEDVFALDTTGEHLLLEKTHRKLLTISPHHAVKGRLIIKLISKGRWNDSVQLMTDDGFTIWRMKQDGNLGMTYVGTLSAAVDECLKS